VQLVISDAHIGLKAAIAGVLLIAPPATGEEVAHRELIPA
jgi:hypothetical protein